MTDINNANDSANVQDNAAIKNLNEEGYPWFDKEDFYDEIGDQIYYGVFHSEANLELAINNLNHVRSFQLKNVPLFPPEVC